MCIVTSGKRRRDVKTFDITYVMSNSRASKTVIRQRSDANIEAARATPEKSQKDAGGAEGRNASAADHRGDRDHLRVGLFQFDDRKRGSTRGHDGRCDAASLPGAG